MFKLRPSLQERKGNIEIDVKIQLFIQNFTRVNASLHFTYVAQNACRPKMEKI